MRRRSSGVVGLGLIALVASWAFGSTPLAVVGLGFLAAGIAARVWARAAAGSLVSERRILPGPRIEGGELVIEVVVRHRFVLLGGSIVVRQRLGDTDSEARVRGGRATVVFPGLVRGRHRLGPLQVTLTDPLGLESASLQFHAPESVLVRPRIPSLAAVFTASGARENGAARSRFRRPTGFEIHAVRDYAPGEPLRSVHWPSTARRGQLMVKELDDAPRDDLVVLLDQDADGVAGLPGQSSFDAAVRAAGAIVLARARENRRVVLSGTADGMEPIAVRSSGRDWGLALDALAGVSSVVGARADRALRSPRGAAMGATDVIVVSSLPGRIVEALLELRRSGSSVALVVVASETYAGQPRRATSAEVLKAVALGIPVAVVSAGQPIEDALMGRPEAATGG